MEYPATLDMARYCTHAAIGDVWGTSTYQLDGIVAHGGIACNGHFQYIQRVHSDPTGDVWVIRNDADLPRAISCSEVMGMGLLACGLIYKRDASDR